jgi:hypothetical protein
MAKMSRRFKYTVNGVEYDDPKSAYAALKEANSREARGDRRRHHHGEPIRSKRRTSF